jgi:hypothetical protein
MINNRIIRKLVFFMPKKIMFWLIKNNFTFIMALFYKVFIIKGIKSKHKSPISNSGKITILALNVNKYRGDPECLSQVNNFRILTIDNNTWQTMLVYDFMKKKISPDAFINAEDDSDIGRCRNKINVFFDGFISALLKLIRIDCVITAHNRYLEDLPWVMHFEKKGIPHICLYREGTLSFDRAYDGVTCRNGRFKGYPVTHLIVQSQVLRKSFVESGFVTEGQVSVCGALRMDNLLKQVNAGKGGPTSKYEKRRKRVILFYISYKMSLFGKEKLTEFEKIYGSKYSYAEVIWPHRFDLFRDLHISIIRLAQKLPDVDFVIKPKRSYMNKKNVSWDKYLGIVNEMGVDFSKLKNYTIEPDANIHDLILNGDVFIALQTSSVLEAAIAGKPVIFPLFYNYKETKNFNDFSYRNHIDLFDVAESAEELEALIIKTLENPKIDNKTVEGRRELFKEWYSDLDGVALKKYSEIIEKFVASAKVKNQHSQSKRHDN